MSQPTQTYKRSLAGSVGAGLSSVFNAGGRSYYILEHKVSSQYHRAGEAQEIIVDQIEIGRDPKCQVQFDEKFSTVSRRHAAIVRDGDNWKLVQLSQTNQTFLNGRPVAKEWYLQNGDEIQLSVNGPKLGFIVPTGNKSKTGSIALSRRLSLFRQQALKPYKTAMTAMAVLIVLLIAGGVTYGVIDDKQDRAVMDEWMRAKGEWEIKSREDSIAIAKAAEERAKMDEKIRKMEQEYNKKIAQPNSNKTIASCEPSIYFVYIRKVVATFEGETVEFENLGSGTGFLLNDGRFITARHVVEPWMYLSGEKDDMLICNAVAHNGGSVVAYLDAYSPTGDRLSFQSNNARINRKSDKKEIIDDITIITAFLDEYDYAYFRTNRSDGLPYDNQLSRTLPVQAKLTVLGYPMGIGANSPNDINPIYSEAVVAREGLHNGLILTTATTFERGNSGGPVFATTTDGDLIVVGLVSAGAGRSTGYVVPISAVK